MDTLTQDKTQMNDQATLDKELPILRVDANAYSWLPDWRELWQYREMLYFLVSRDIKVRYRQTVLGAAWAIIQPLTSMVFFTLFFNKVAQISSDGIPYPIFSFSALVPWTFFVNGVSLGADSLVGQAHLVRKVYFPRLLVPLARILGGIVDLGLALVVLLLMMLAYGYVPKLESIVVIPALVVLATVLTLGVTLWLSALNVSYRDIRYVVPFLTQLWLFATPIAYPASLIKDDTLRALYSLNPMVCIIEGFRWVLLGHTPPSVFAVLSSVVITLVLLVTGLLYFHRAEGIFADVI